MRADEFYKLDCHGCGHTVELHAGPPDFPQLLTCPRCGAGLEIEWRGHRTEAAAGQIGGSA
jgi:hypothetical protein